MKLNDECVRDLLLALEENLTLKDNLGFEKLYFNDIIAIERLKAYTSADIFYTLYTLNDAGYINAYILYGMKNAVRTCYVENITAQGHAFIKNISSNKIWKAVKATASKVGGLSLSMLSEVAEQYIRQKLGL